MSITDPCLTCGAIGHMTFEHNLAVKLQMVIDGESSIEYLWPHAIKSDGNITTVDIDTPFRLDK